MQSGLLNQPALETTVLQPTLIVYLWKSGPTFPPSSCLSLKLNHTHTCPFQWQVFQRKRLRCCTIFLLELLSGLFQVAHALHFTSTFMIRVEFADNLIKFMDFQCPMLFIVYIELFRLRACVFQANNFDLQGIWLSYH